jgi:hypothetical protein
MREMFDNGKMLQLIVAGFFVCLDSFLSLLTIMPARIVITIWRVLKTRCVMNAVVIERIEEEERGAAAELQYPPLQYRG